MNAKSLKAGVIIEYRGELWRTMQATHMSPGKGRAFVQAKLRNVVSGTQTEIKFRSDENLERAVLEQREVQYLYQEGGAYCFMDTENYEQFHLSEEMLGDSTLFLKPNMNLQVESYEGKPMGVQLPKTVTLKVVETEPYVKTATVTNSYKAAKVETGATVQVPGFISEGEEIDIEIESGKYLGRGKS